MYFSTLPPGSALPSDQTCASEVQQAAEVRPNNATYNDVLGTQKNLTSPYPTYSRVDGNFTGTTDQIIQWVACKWGIDENVVRAQAAVGVVLGHAGAGRLDHGRNAVRSEPPEVGSDPAHPSCQCPESVGLLQVRYPYWQNGFNQVETSTAYNADYAYAEWRACYDGQETWLNTVSHVGTYAAGDLWGCIGVCVLGTVVHQSGAGVHRQGSVRSQLEDLDHAPVPRLYMRLG